MKFFHKIQSNSMDYFKKGWVVIPFMNIIGIFLYLLDIVKDVYTVIILLQHGNSGCRIFTVVFVVVPIILSYLFAAYLIVYDNDVDDFRSKKNTRFYMIMFMFLAPILTLLIKV
ncbi:unnamed protein product [Meganyctiphanes norvegica]|uniref:XK-related protein n=1 Tax=Meganyctiphanes norvegica TaxID=48144 RepID=A0AAV2RZS8_MEGNR